MCLGTKCDGAKMCLVVLGTKLRWGQIVSGDKMFGPKGVRPKLAGPNCEAAKLNTYVITAFLSSSRTGARNEEKKQ